MNQHSRKNSQSGAAQESSRCLPATQWSQRVPQDSGSHFQAADGTEHVSKALQAKGCSGSWQSPPRDGLGLFSSTPDIQHNSFIICYSCTGQRDYTMQSPSPLNQLPNYFPPQEKELGGSLTVENIAENRRSVELLISRASERVNNPHC